MHRPHWLQKFLFICIMCRHSIECVNFFTNVDVYIAHTEFKCQGYKKNKYNTLLDIN